MSKFDKINFCRGQDVFLVNTGLGNEEVQRNVQELLRLKPKSLPPDGSGELSLAIALQYWWGITVFDFHTINAPYE